MISAAFDAAWQATWPAAAYADAGGLRSGRGLGGGGRLSASRRIGALGGGDIAAAEAQHRDWDQPPLFAVEQGDDELAAALAARGYAETNPTLILSAPVAALADRAIPGMTVLESWPPLAIQRDLWSALGIGPSRQAAMQRAASPRTALLGRLQDRAAGVGFVSAQGDWAFLHALAVVPAMRGQGLGGWMVRRAAGFAAEAGATSLALAVSEANTSACGLYATLGFARIGGYAYWQRPPATGR